MSMLKYVIESVNENRRRHIDVINEIRDDSRFDSIDDTMSRVDDSYHQESVEDYMDAIEVINEMDNEI